MGTSTMEPIDGAVTLPTVTTSAGCAAAGAAGSQQTRERARSAASCVALRPIVFTFPLFMTPLFITRSLRSRARGAGRCAAHLEVAAGDGRRREAGGVAQHRRGRIEGGAERSGCLELDLGDD